MRLVLVSDTHTMGCKLKVPDGDVLIHAGDLTFQGTHDETYLELEWLESLPHKHKLFIAGNHDFYFDKTFANGQRFRHWKIDRPIEEIETTLANFPSLTYLQDSSVIIDGRKFYGSPWQPWYYDWAFQFRNGDRNQAAAKWEEIPLDTEILITHGPPQGILDTADDYRKLGCGYLRDRLEDLTQLELHVFGHIHESYGVKADTGLGVIFVNAASNNINYHPVNPPIVIDL